MIIMTIHNTNTGEYYLKRLSSKVSKLTLEYAEKIDFGQPEVLPIFLDLDENLVFWTELKDIPMVK